MSKILKSEHPHGGHRQRMKKRLLRDGIDGFEPHEIMEIMLYFTNPRKDTNELGHTLIRTFGSVRNVINAPFEELVKVKGIGENTASMICFFKELVRVYAREEASLKCLDTPQALQEYCRALFLGKSVEQIRILCLNHEMQLIKEELISEGEIGAVNVDIRKMVEVIIRNKCDTVVVSHNHPQGNEMPSKSDIVSTRRIFNALANINVRLIDHIIVGRSGETSLRSTGLMPDIWQ